MGVSQGAVTSSSWITLWVGRKVYWGIKLLGLNLGVGLWDREQQNSVRGALSVLRGHIEGSGVRAGAACKWEQPGGYLGDSDAVGLFGLIRNKTPIAGHSWPWGRQGEK